MRKLGKTEHFYWLYNRIESTNFVISANLGNVSFNLSIEPYLERTIKAFRRLQETVKVQGRNKLAFKHTSTYKTTIRYRIGSRENYLEFVSNELSAGFDPEKAPVRALVYFLLPDEIYIMALTFNHVFTDAKGGMCIMSNLLDQIYSQVTVSKKKEESLPAQEKKLPWQVKGLPLLWYSLKYLRRNIRAGYTDREKQLLNASFNHHAGRSIAIRQRKVEKHLADKLIATCKTKGVSVTSFLSAVQISVIRDHIHSGGDLPVTINIPFDNRTKLLPAGIQFLPGLYITIPKITARCSRNPDLWELTYRIDAELKRLQSSPERYLTFQLFPCFLFSTGRKGIARLKSALSDKPVSSTLTNLGKIEPSFPSVSEHPISRLEFFAAPSATDAILTSVINYKGIIYMNFTLNTSLIDKARVDDIIDRFFARISLMV